eukprot:scaffold92387_cov63-Phaeocystis_antarctica.AAC.2
MGHRGAKRAQCHLDRIGVSDRPLDGSLVPLDRDTPAQAKRRAGREQAAAHVRLNETARRVDAYLRPLGLIRLTPAHGLRPWTALVHGRERAPPRLALALGAQRDVAHVVEARKRAVERQRVASRARPVQTHARVLMRQHGAWQHGLWRAQVMGQALFIHLDGTVVRIDPQQEGVTRFVTLAAQRQQPLVLELGLGTLEGRRRGRRCPPDGLCRQVESLVANVSGRRRRRDRCTHRLGLARVRVRKAVATGALAPSTGVVRLRSSCAADAPSMGGSCSTACAQLREHAATLASLPNTFVVLCGNGVRSFTVLASAMHPGAGN